MKKGTVIYQICLVLTILLLPVQGHAALISVDDVNLGVGVITRDTDTALDWLDLTITAGTTYNYVSSQTGAGGTYQGFRHATFAELSQFWTNAGIPEITPLFFGIGPGLFSAANRQPILDLFDLIGTTAPFPGQPIRHTLGITQEVHLGGDGTLVFQLVAGLRTTDVAGSADLNDSIIQPNISDPTFGHYLVRSAPIAAIPEPETYAMLGLGLGLMGWVVRRKKLKDRAAA
jgi:hypothetical protein